MVASPGFLVGGCRPRWQTPTSDAGAFQRKCMQKWKNWVLLGRRNVPAVPTWSAMLHRRRNLKLTLASMQNVDPEPQITQAGAIYIQVGNSSSFNVGHHLEVIGARAAYIPPGNSPNLSVNHHLEVIRTHPTLVWTITSKWLEQGYLHPDQVLNSQQRKWWTIKSKLKKFYSLKNTSSC